MHTRYKWLTYSPTYLSFNFEIMQSTKLCLFFVLNIVIITHRPFSSSSKFSLFSYVIHEAGSRICHCDPLVCTILWFRPFQALPHPRLPWFWGVQSWLACMVRGSYGPRQRKLVAEIEAHVCEPSAGTREHCLWSSWSWPLHWCCWWKDFVLEWNVLDWFCIHLPQQVTLLFFHPFANSAAKYN